MSVSNGHLSRSTNLATKPEGYAPMDRMGDARIIIRLLYQTTNNKGRNRIAFDE